MAQKSFSPNKANKLDMVKIFNDYFACTCAT